MACRRRSTGISSTTLASEWGDWIDDGMADVNWVACSEQWSNQLELRNRIIVSEFIQSKTLT